MSPRHQPQSNARAVHRAFSLVELLVAMAVGAIVVLGLVDVLINSRVSYLREDQFARLQEAGRYAMLTIAKRLRSTRSLDCENLVMHEFRRSLSVSACSLLDLAEGQDCNAAEVDLTTQHLLKAERALGYDGSQKDEAGWLSDLPPAAQTAVSANHFRGDVLVTWGVSGAGILMSNGSAPGVPSDIVVAPGGPAFARGALALVSDCSGADLFEVTGVTDETTLSHAATSNGGASSNATDVLSRAYNWSAASAQAEPDDGAEAARTGTGPFFSAQVYPFRYSVYYICCVDNEVGGLAPDPSECNDAPDTFRPSLCVWDTAGGNESLVLDVADLRVTYSGDSDGDWVADFFAGDTGTVHNAQWVSEQNAWAGVSGAMVELLVASARDGVRTASGSTALAEASSGHGSADGSSGTDEASDAGADSGGDTMSAPDDPLGAHLPADRRLYERFVLSVALRSRTPWYLTQ